MANCEKINDCSFYYDRAESMPTISELFRTRLCKGDSSKCARYQLYKFLFDGKYEISEEAEEKICLLSANLLPNQFERIKEIIPQISKQ